MQNYLKGIKIGLGLVTALFIMRIINLIGQLLVCFLLLHQSPSILKTIEFLLEFKL